PSLLERGSPGPDGRARSGFNRESDSVTVGATWATSSPVPSLLFQSRKRFRPCWSRNTCHLYLLQVSHVSIAKAIPSLLERNMFTLGDGTNRLGFNRESDSVTVGARVP